MPHDQVEAALLKDMCIFQDQDFNCAGLCDPSMYLGLPGSRVPDLRPETTMVGRCRTSYLLLGTAVKEKDANYLC